MELTNQVLPYLIAFGVTALAVIIFYLIYSMMRGTDGTATYNDQLEHLLEDEYMADQEPPQPNMMDKWNAYWGKIAKDAGVGNYSERYNSAGRDVILLGLIVAGVVALIFQNIFAGIVVSAGGIFVLSGALRGLSNRKEELLNNQLPGFLFALKSNIAANETAEKAMIKVVDTMPSPLYEDLYIVKSKLQANSSFKEALTELKEKTTSRDLEFLAACMIQAVGNGENIEDQITTIQKVLEERQKVSQEITRSLKTVSPATIIASIAIPGSFVASYFMDANARNFWFVEPISWIAFIAVGVLWVVGIWMSRRLASSIRNL